MQKNEQLGWVYFIIVLLGLTLLIRLIDEAQLITHFPFGFTNDISSYIAQLHFMKTCGFHQWCPYWYNGFVHLLVNQPGWYFFAYPLYLLFGNVLAATYASMVILYLLGFVAIWILGKHLQIDKIKRVAFYLLFFANAGIIGNTLMNIRQHAMLTLVLLVFLFTLVWYYKDRPIRWPFFLTSVVYSFMIVTHYQETILAGLLFVSLLIYKRAWKERIAVVGAGILSVLLSLWWVKGFLTALSSSSLLTFHEGARIFEWSKEVVLTNLFTFIIPAVFIVLWWYVKKIERKEHRDWIFFLPIAVLAILYFFRLTAFIPVIQNISQDPYLSFFLFFLFVILFTYEEKLFSRPFVSALVRWGIIAVTIGSVLVSMFYTPFFERAHSLDEEIISLFPHVDGRMLFISQLQDGEGLISYNKPLYSYAAIYYGISTSAGWSPPVTNTPYLDRIDPLEKLLTRPDATCEQLKTELTFFNTANVITTLGTCDQLAACELKKLASTEHACLYSTSSSL